MKYTISKKTNVKRKESIIQRVKRKFTKKDSKYKKSAARRLRGDNYMAKLLQFVVIILIIPLFASVIYLIFNYVTSLRQSINSDTVSTGVNVIGFDSIPEYPKSKYIFKDNLDNDDVKKFLSSGQAIYRLDPKTTFDDVIEYYSIELPKNGWEYVLTVPLESEEQKYGEYWIKGELGVRIYSKLNDIWYQTITVSDARTGLEAQVKKEVELQLLLTENNNEDLRPDFPWVLSYSSDYLATYSSTDLGELQAVKFQRIGSNKSVRIIPLGYMGAFTYDRFLENALKDINKKEKVTWSIINTVVTAIAGQEAISGKITNNGAVADAYIVGNPRNNVVYLLISSEESDPFLKFIVERIEPAGTSLF